MLYLNSLFLLSAFSSLSLNETEINVNGWRMSSCLLFTLFFLTFIQTITEQLRYDEWRRKSDIAAIRAPIDVREEILGLNKMWNRKKGLLLPSCMFFFFSLLSTFLQTFLLYLAYLTKSNESIMIFTDPHTIRFL